MITLKRSSCLIVSALLAGCAVGPDFKQPAAPSQAGYSSAPLAASTTSAPGTLGQAQRLVNGMDIPGQWWTLFQSKPLDSLIERAFKANPTITAAQAALTVSRENMLAQGGTLLPSIGVDASASRNATSTASLAPVAANNQRIYSLDTGALTVSYALDVFGLNRRTIESAAAQAESQRFELEAAYLTLSSNIVLAAVNQASLHGQVSAQEEIIKIETEMRDTLQREYAVGEVAQTDLLQQDTLLAQAKQQLPSLQKQLALQRDALAALVGCYPNQDVGADFDLSSLQLPVDLPVSIPSRLVEQRPDVQAAAANLHAATAQVGVAIAERLPQLSLTAALGTSPSTFASAFTPYNQFFSVLGQASQPIFQGGALLHRQRAAQAAVDQSTAQYRATVINAFQNVADVLQSVQADARTLQAAVATEQSAAHSLTIARQASKVGETPYVSVLNAEQAYEMARIALVQAQATRLADSAALFQALGGGWWNRPDPTAVAHHNG